VEDGAVRAIAVGVAFHWFDGERAVPEMARVVAPGGTVALLWHRPLEPLRTASPWRQEIRDLLDGLRDDSHPGFQGEQGREAFAGDARFGPFEYERFEYEHPTDRDALIAEVSSLSYIAVRPEAERRAILARVAEILDRHGITEITRRLPADLWLTRRA
jgi:SAM-dependent methyltransferase